ncbi:MAG: hypothetical protein GY838_13555 [bacterium]|nr:hypothetical protein [bacterium]
MPQNLALYLLKNKHVRTPDTLPLPLDNFALAVSTISLNVANAQAVAPETLLAGYFDFTSVPHYGSDTSPHGQLRSDLEEFVKRGPDDGAPVETRSGNYYLQPTFDAYDAYAQWIAEYMNCGDFNAIYIDNGWVAVPDQWRRDLGLDRDEAATRHPKLRNYFLERIWDLIDESRPIIPNIGSGWGPMPDPIDGFSVEHAGLRPGDVAPVLGRFQALPSSYNILWRRENNETNLNLSGFGGVLMDGYRCM